MPGNKVIVQFKHFGPAPKLNEAANDLGVLVEELDEAYGVIPISEEKSIYSVLVDDRAVNRVEAALNARPKDPEEGVKAA